MPNAAMSAKVDLAEAKNGMRWSEDGPLYLCSLPEFLVF